MSVRSSIKSCQDNLVYIFEVDKDKLINTFWLVFAYVCDNILESVMFALGRQIGIENNVLFATFHLNSTF